MCNCKKNVRNLPKPIVKQPQRSGVSTSTNNGNKRAVTIRQK